MTKNVKRAGRPRKMTRDKVVKRNTAYVSENYAYVLGILEERKLQVSGHFSKVLNEIITDHRKVKANKERQAHKLKGELAVLGE